MSKGSWQLPRQSANRISNTPIANYSVTQNQNAPTTIRKDINSHAHLVTHGDPVMLDQESPLKLAAPTSNVDPAAISSPTSEDTHSVVSQSKAASLPSLTTPVTTPKIRAIGHRDESQKVIQDAADAASSTSRLAATVEDGADVARQPRELAMLPVQPKDAKHGSTSSPPDVHDADAVQEPDQQDAAPVRSAVRTTEDAAQAKQVRKRRIVLTVSVVLLALAFACYYGQEWLSTTFPNAIVAHAKDWSLTASETTPVCSCESAFPEPLLVCQSDHECQELSWALEVQDDARQTCRHIADRHDTFDAAVELRQAGFPQTEVAKINALINVIYTPTKAINTHAQTAQSLWVRTQDHFLSVVREAYSREYERENCPSCYSLDSGELPITALLETVEGVSHILFKYIIDPVFQAILQDADDIITAKKTASRIWDANRHRPDILPSIACFLSTLSVDLTEVKFRCSTDDRIQYGTIEELVYMHWRKQHALAVRRGGDIIDTIHRGMDAALSAHNRLEHMWKAVLQPLAAEQDAARAQAQHEGRAFQPARLFPWFEPDADAAEPEMVPATEYLRRVACVALLGAQVDMTTAVGQEMRSLHETLDLFKPEE